MTCVKNDAVFTSPDPVRLKYGPPLTMISAVFCVIPDRGSHVRTCCSRDHADGCACAQGRIRGRTPFEGSAEATDHELLLIG